MSKGLEDGINEFNKFCPQAFKYLGEFSYDGRKKKSYAALHVRYNTSDKKITQGINLGEMMKDYNNFINHINRDLKSNFHYKGTDEKTVIVHELTHALNYQLAIDNLNIDVNNCDRAKWMQLQSEALKIAKDIKERALRSMFIDPTSEEARREILKLGRYAFTNDLEFLAEAVSEGLCVGNTKIGQAVIKILKEVTNV